jgi:ribulose-phosphate 3-epimerase
MSSKFDAVSAATVVHERRWTSFWLFTVRPRLNNFKEMRMKQYLIAPSILSADFARLGEDTAKALAAGADVVHFDVMDNHYVPNLTIGPMVLKALRNYGITAPIDVHLMVKPVDRIIPDFAAAGASIITFHPEASEHVDRSLQLIKEHGCKAGLVFNPATPLSYLDYVMDKLDVILLMSVNPGSAVSPLSPRRWINCVKCASASMRRVTTFVWKSTAA